MIEYSSQFWYDFRFVKLPVSIYQYKKHENFPAIGNSQQ